jgi:polar amino acid transport system substrate-binding protein
MRRLLPICVLAAALAAGAASAAPRATVEPGVLTVGVSLPSEGFQVGAVKGSTVVLARGLEIDLARALGRRLDLPVRFVQSRFDRLTSAGAKPWDLALAQITITEARRRSADFSAPYMEADQGVLLAQTVPARPRSLAALRALRLCALAKSTGAALVTGTIRPTTKPLFVGNVPLLMLDLQTGRCDAVVYDAPSLGTLKSRAPQRFGPFAGVIETGEQYGIALPQGSALRARVNRALRALAADGTLERLQRKWVTAHLDELPVLR